MTVTKKDVIKGFPNTVTAVTSIKNENELNKQTESSQESGFKKQEQNISSKEFVDNDIINLVIYSRYQYTKKDIDNFFASIRGQKEKHTLEESICRPLIGLQNNKPFFKYCKICPKVEFQSDKY